MTNDEIVVAELAPDDCTCEHKALLYTRYIEVLHAKSHEKQADAYGRLTVICGTFICIIVFCFFTFLMLSSWFEHKVTMEMAIVATILGVFVTMVGALFGVSQKKIIQNAMDIMVVKK